MKYWQSKDKTIGFELENVKGYKYWPACNQSVGLSYGGLTVFLSGGKVDLILSEETELLLDILKERFDYEPSRTN